MESKITVNGVDYDRVEDMPADVREIYEKAMGQARPQLPGLNLTLAEHHTTQHGGAVKHTFFVNGKTYDSEQDMPADVREQYEKAMAMLKSGDAKVTGNDIKLTFEVGGPHFRFGKSLGLPTSPNQRADPAVPAPQIPAPIEPSSGGSGLRLLVAAAAFAMGGFVVWLLVRGH